jgi:hypothetical protein
MARWFTYIMVAISMSNTVPRYHVEQFHRFGNRSSAIKSVYTDYHNRSRTYMNITTAGTTEILQDPRETTPKILGTFYSW